MHLHGLNLGLPGNAATTLETLQALDGHRAHLAHIQFHSYGGTIGDTSSVTSDVARLADYVNTHANLTVDVGQVLFGETTSMTADGAVGQFLHSVTGRKWLSHDVELETGCGVVPITYDDKNFVHALQWAIGLEWYLRVDDPWRIAMSTDHPNGGSFLAYPQIIALLMDRGLRADLLKRLPERARARTRLADLSREYSLAEIAIITRAAPARMLGLTAEGPSRPRCRRRRHHLRPRRRQGADVLPAPLRDQGGRGRPRRRRAAGRPRRADPVGRARVRRGDRPRARDPGSPAIPRSSSRTSP